ncbi:MAG: hypothetical protein ACM3JF_02970 [Sphaerimonospora mesophila]
MTERIVGSDGNRQTGSVIDLTDDDRRQVIGAFLETPLSSHFNAAMDPNDPELEQYVADAFAVKQHIIALHKNGAPLNEVLGAIAAFNARLGYSKSLVYPTEASAIPRELMLSGEQDRDIPEKPGWSYHSYRYSSQHSRFVTIREGLGFLAPDPDVEGALKIIDQQTAEIYLEVLSATTKGNLVSQRVDAPGANEILSRTGVMKDNSYLKFQPGIVGTYFPVRTFEQEDGAWSIWTNAERIIAKSAEMELCELAIAVSHMDRWQDADVISASIRVLSERLDDWPADPSKRAEMIACMDSVVTARDNETDRAQEALDKKKAATADIRAAIGEITTRIASGTQPSSPTKANFEI